MKRIKVLVVASVFAVMTIGAANSFAQYIYEEPILVTSSAQSNANNTPAATPTPKPPRPAGGGGGQDVVVFDVIDANTYL